MKQFEDNELNLLRLQILSGSRMQYQSGPIAQEEQLKLKCNLEIIQTDPGFEPYFNPDWISEFLGAPAHILNNFHNYPYVLSLPIKKGARSWKEKGITIYHATRGGLPVEGVFHIIAPIFGITFNFKNSETYEHNLNFDFKVEGTTVQVSAHGFQEMSLRGNQIVPISNIKPTFSAFLAGKFKEWIYKNVFDTPHDMAVPVRDLEENNLRLFELIKMRIKDEVIAQGFATPPKKQAAVIKSREKDKILSTATYLPAAKAKVLDEDLHLQAENKIPAQDEDEEALLQEALAISMSLQPSGPPGGPALEGSETDKEKAQPSELTDELKKLHEVSQVKPKNLCFPLLKLPHDLLENIFGMLSFKDGEKLYHVSKFIREMVKKDHFEWADGKRIDFLLMMDATESMGSYLESAKLTLNNLLETLKSHQKIQKHDESRKLEARKEYHLRMAWLEYRDIADRISVKLRDFVTDPEKIAGYIANSRAEGGDDIPENVAGALQHALNDLSWTKNVYCHALKIIILVLDAPPHGMGGEYRDNYPDKLPKPYENTDWISIAHQMKKKGIIVHTLLCGKNCEQLNLFGTTLSNITGGKCLYMEDAKHLGEFILANICADIELEEILSEKLSVLLPDNSDARHQLAERLFKIIEEDRSLMIPAIDAQTVNHLKTAPLSKTLSVAEARVQGILPRHKVLSRMATEPFPKRAVGLPASADAKEGKESEEAKGGREAKEIKEGEIKEGKEGIMELLDSSPLPAERSDEILGSHSIPAAIPICRTFTEGGSVLFSYGAGALASIRREPPRLPDLGAAADLPLATLSFMPPIAEEEEATLEEATIKDDSETLALTPRLTPTLDETPISGEFLGLLPLDAGLDLKSGEEFKLVRENSAIALSSEIPSAAAAHAPSIAASEHAASAAEPTPVLHSALSIRRSVSEAVSSEVLRSRIASAIARQRSAR